MQSLLGRASHAEVRPLPFPHVVIHSAIDDGLCDRLVREYPAADVITRGADPGSNKRFSCPTVRALTDPRVTDLWRDFVTWHVSPQFLAEVLDLFHEHLTALYPALAAERGGIRQWRSGVRLLNDFDEADVLLDAQISLNTPVCGGPSSVRGPHVDLPKKLFAGLFYLRSDDDESAGGDLELFRFKGEPAGFTGMSVAETELERVDTVRYGKNVLVLFLNSPRSVHGVTMRSETPAPRLFLNLVGECWRPLFSVDRYQTRPAPPPEECLTGGVP